jgi:hypothetical protein
VRVETEKKRALRLSMKMLFEENSPVDHNFPKTNNIALITDSKLFAEIDAGDNKPDSYVSACPHLGLPQRQ